MSLVARYEYPDAKGRVLLQKLRFEITGSGSQDCPFPAPEKAFRMEARRRTGYVWVNPSALMRRYPESHAYFHSLLYGLPDLLAAMQTHEHGTVYWTEGEKDADSARAAGGLAVTHWQGAPSADFAQALRLRRWRGVVALVSDVDARGAEDVLARYRLCREVGIPSDRLRVVRPADEPVEKRDLTDHLQDGYSLDDLVPMDLHKLERYVARLTPTQRGSGSSDWTIPASQWRATTGRDASKEVAAR